MQVQRSGVFLAVLAATAVVGVGAQAASRAAATLPTAPAHEQTPLVTETPQGQTNWEQQMKDAIAKTQAFGATLIGMNITDAEQLAQSSGFTLRIVERDGESFAITMDYRTDRVDVKVTNDIITEYSVG